MRRSTPQGKLFEHADSRTVPNHDRVVTHRGVNGDWLDTGIAGLAIG